MTNFIQPIDAGLGRSVRCTIRNLLDEWLMNEDNLIQWESKMTACERRILTTKFVSGAMNDIMSIDKEKDESRMF